MDNEDTYFARLPSDECAAECVERIIAFNDARADHASRWDRNYDFYYNKYFYGENNLATSVTFGGEQGELTLMPVNHFKNILQNWQVLITSIIPSYIPRAINSDFKSQAQTKLARNLIDFYNKEADIDTFTTNAVLHSLIMDTGYIKVEWNPTKGKEYAVDDEENVFNEGDIGVSLPTAYDIVFDVYKKEFSENDWVMERTTTSKWDLIQTIVGDDEDEELDETQSKIKKALMNTTSTNESILSEGPSFVSVTTDDIQVFEFWHKKTPALPDGRFMKFTEDGTVIQDGPIPYREIPIYQISSGVDIRNQFGYSVANDLAPIQEALNSEYSTVLTNHETFGVQTIAVPRDSNVKASDLGKGLKLLEYNTVDAPGGGQPKAVNFTQTPPEIFNAIAMFKSDMELISGINSVIRGQPDSQLKSGTAIALVQNQALAYASNLQKSYSNLLENIGTSIIRLLRDFATTKRMISIAGKHNRSAMQEFTGDDLVNVDRVIVDLGNPLAQTLAGRVELAQNLIQTGLIKTVEEYVTVTQTGSLDSLTEQTFSELQNIHAENEELMDQNVVNTIATDDHRLHILEHKILMDAPETRANAPYIANVMAHIQQHIQMMMDPNVAILSQVLGNMSLAGQNEPAGPPMPTGEAPPPDILTEIPQSVTQQPQAGLDVRQPNAPRNPTVPQR